MAGSSFDADAAIGKYSSQLFEREPRFPCWRSPVMKKLLFALALMPVTAMYAVKPKPDPAAYTVTVHVIGSANRSLVQHLEVVIDGQTMELVSVNGGYGGLLALGDYKAKYINMAPKTHAIYDYWNRYEIYFPSDGAVRDYDEIAIGAPPPACDAPGVAASGANPAP
jgi:hypothetical protein